MNARKIVPVLVQVSRFGLAALFLVTAAAKLATIKGFAANMGELVSASGLSQSLLTWPATVGVILAEFVTVVMLLTRRLVRFGAVLAGLLLLGFSAFALYYRFGLGYPEGLECGCFGGIIASQLGVTTALRNLVLLLPALIVFIFFDPRKHTNH